MYVKKARLVCRKCTKPLDRNGFLCSSCHVHSNSKTRNKKYKGSPLVYAFFDGGEAVYVGRGSRYRVNKHRFTSSWWTPNLLVITMDCKDEWEAMEYEGKWGGLYHPKMNKDGYRY
jgi:hypothetical protein